MPTSRRRPPLPRRNKQRSAPLVEVVLCERERLLEAQAGAPQDDDHRSQAPAVTVIGRAAQHGHDLVDGRRIGRVAHPLVTRRPAGVVARHRHRPAAPPGRSQG
jgi:hypothetical protein